jgi:uncharacterized protein (DUF305 family)
MKKYIITFLAITFAISAQAADSGHAKAYEESMHKMHAGMMIEYSADADADFVRGMIPHHQGAIDMAKIQLKYGTDPEIRKLAEGIIVAQEAEIAQMNEWLAQRTKK